MVIRYIICGKKLTISTPLCDKTPHRPNNYALNNRISYYVDRCDDVLSSRAVVVATLHGGHIRVKSKNNRAV